MLPDQARSWLTRRWVQCVILYVLAAALYVYNASPQPGYVDSAMVAANVYSLRVSSWVNVHLLHNLVGRLWLFIFPWGEMGWRLTILGGLITAGAVVNLYRLLLDLEVRPRNAIVTAFGAALAHALWWHAVTIEVYCINAFFTPLICQQILRYERTGDLRWYYRAAFYYGLSAVNHVLMGLFLFAFIGSVCNRRGAKAILRPVVAAKTLGWFVLGWQPALLILFNDIVNTANRSAYRGEDGAVHVPLGEALRTVLDAWSGGDFKRQMFVEEGSFGGRVKWLKGGLIALFYDFPNALLVLAPAGMVAAWRNRELRLTHMFIAGGFLANFVWVLNYAVWDQWAFAVPSYMIWAMYAGLGLEALNRRFEARGAPQLGKLAAGITAATLAINPWLYVSIEKWAREDGLWKSYFHFFDGDYFETFHAGDYFASPFRRDWDQPRRYAERVWEIVPEGGVIYDDHARTFFLLHLYYNACLGIRRDIASYNTGIMGPWIESIRPHGERMLRDLAEQKPVFMTSVQAMPGRAQLAYLAAVLNAGDDADANRLVRAPLPEVLAQLPQLHIEGIPIFEDEPFRIYRVSIKPNHLMVRNIFEESQIAVTQAPNVGELETVESKEASGGQLARWTVDAESLASLRATPPPSDGEPAAEPAAEPTNASFTLQFALAGDTQMGLRLGLRAKESGVVNLRLDGEPLVAASKGAWLDLGERLYPAGVHDLTVELTEANTLELDYLEFVPVGFGLDD